MHSKKLDNCGHIEGLKTQEDQVSTSGISCNGHSPDPSTACTWPMDIAHRGAGRTHPRLAYSADICHLRGADQGAQTTSLPETETAAPDTSHNPSTDRTIRSQRGRWYEGWVNGWQHSPQYARRARRCRAIMIPLPTAASIVASTSTSIGCDNPDSRRTLLASIAPMRVATPGK